MHQRFVTVPCRSSETEIQQVDCIYVKPVCMRKAACEVFHYYLLYVKKNLILEGKKNIIKRRLSLNNTTMSRRNIRDSLFGVNIYCMSSARMSCYLFIYLSVYLYISICLFFIIKRCVEMTFWRSQRLMTSRH